MSAHQSVSDIVVQRMAPDAWKSWVKTLKTGDIVLVCSKIGNKSIYQAHRSASRRPGKCFSTTNRRDRTDWGKHQEVDTHGGGTRFIAPLPPELTSAEEAP